MFLRDAKKNLKFPNTIMKYSVQNGLRLASSLALAFEVNEQLICKA